MKKHDVHRHACYALTVSIALFGPQACDAQLRVVTYNTATSGENFSPVEPRPGLATVLTEIGNESVGGIVRPIDVLLLQEQASVSTSTQAITDLLNEVYGEGTYARGRVNGGTNGGGRAGIVYNTTTVELRQERAFGRLASTAQARQTLRYTLRPIGYDERSDFYAYVNHYKSGTSETDQRRRNVEAVAIRSNADALGENVQAIYAGDFNIQRCSETMFQTLTSDGPAQGIDPIANEAGCIWKDRISARESHTQSPASDSSTGLIRGGVDDRFDFQLVTNNLLDGEGLSLISSSYHAFGNNGTHRMNGPINDPDNTALPQPTLDALAASSDHLPVVADYQLPAIMSVTTTPIPKKVLVGTTLQLDVSLQNIAPVTHAMGADELDYSLEFGAIGIPQLQKSGMLLASGQPTEFLLSLPTHSAATVAYGLNVRSDSQNAMNRNFSSAGSYTVLESSIGSLRQNETLASDDVSMVFAWYEDAEIPFSIHNVANELGAGLDLDEFLWDGDLSFMSNLVTFDNLEAGQSRNFAVSVPTTSLGDFQSQLLLNISDEDGIFGEQNNQLAINYSIRVALAGDANLDNKVGFDDFLLVSANFGDPLGAWSEGDFDRDGAVGFGDFLMLSANFGKSVGETIVNTPEPGGFLPLGCLVLALLPFRTLYSG